MNTNKLKYSCHRHFKMRNGKHVFAGLFWLKRVLNEGEVPLYVKK